MTQFKNMDEALPILVSKALQVGEEVGSRRGERTLELLHEHIELLQPWQREILTPRRNVNIAAQIAETMWVLAGRNDVEWLSHYLPRAAEFSDDGQVWRGGYGPRLRGWSLGDAAHGTAEKNYSVDQVRHVVDLLTRDRTSRRAVISIYDPRVDTADGKDIPCNDFLSFISRGGALHLSVFVRSNDVIWGWSGINAFEWSALQEIVAGLLGLQVGRLVFNTTSLHIYDRHWKKARRIEDDREYLPVSLEDSPRFSGDAVLNASAAAKHPVDDLDVLLSRWFVIEKKIREGDPNVDHLIEGFPEPMLRSWLRVLAWYWSGDRDHLVPLEGTRLEMATWELPKSIAEEVKARGASETPAEPPLAHKTEFIKFVVDLHREKSAAYGDSWKKRGEQMSILANIARKVDRLESGTETSDEIIADTAIDLLLYLVKYRNWLTDMFPTVPAFYPTESRDENVVVAATLEHLAAMVPLSPTPDAVGTFVSTIVSTFQRLEAAVKHDPGCARPLVRLQATSHLLMNAFPLARHLWEKENVPESHAVRNEARVWLGYDA